MASVLYRLGRLAYRRRRYVVVLWVAALAALAFAAAKAPPAPDEAFSIPGTESEKAFDLLDERFPGTTANGAFARIAFVAPAGRALHRPEIAHQAAGDQPAPPPPAAVAVGPASAESASVR
ncbi:MULTISPECIES: hypothetical protein [unclassified Pseudofrankia]|uniref:hypothetical protein n=1 Tax=unclassified Pseudofrankia TaxID=2994372 RepID=UPI0008D96DE1|nr:MULTISPECIES: hypothetical protein [unclassified Pseudofrankia]MDT3439148.1 hypothetical protein [Pseudofrankia sp. BMG5.37]OHV45739.1 hypothetical protein BCD48_21395 [Pseudofrankia sp. BMG5.36]